MIIKNNHWPRIITDRNKQSGSDRQFTARGNFQARLHIQIQKAQLSLCVCTYIPVQYAMLSLHLAIL